MIVAKCLEKTTKGKKGIFFPSNLENTVHHGGRHGGSACHIVSMIKRQREMTAHAQLTVSFSSLVQGPRPRTDAAHIHDGSFLEIAPWAHCGMCFHDDSRAGAVDKITPHSTDQRESGLCEKKGGVVPGELPQHRGQA